jgi:methylphosphotriester-DNA--protein-cysteine methyltransferase
MSIAETPIAVSHEIDAPAREVGTSARTLSRLFPSETQLSFKSCSLRARIAAAIERLSMGAQRLGQATRPRSRLCRRAGIFARVPAGHRQDPTQFSETK